MLGREGCGLYISVNVDHGHLPANIVMECYQDDFKWNFKAKKSLRVIIVGAGIAGLATAIGIFKYTAEEYNSR